MAFGFQAGQLYVPITLDQSKFNTALQGVEAKLKQTEASLKGFADVGKRLESVGKGFSLYVTAPIAALGAVAVKSSIDMESAFAGVRKTVDATEEQFAELRKGFVAMSKEIPIATTELFGIGEAAGQLGIKREHILQFSEVMAKLGATTNLSSTQAATALARLANITQMSMTDVDRLGATVVALGNSLATTEAEIVQMGLRLAGAGKQVGLTEAQILSFSGALSSVGIEAEAGGSAFSRVMLNINNEVLGAGENLQLFAQVAGLSAQEFAEAWKQDAAGALTLFIEGLGQMQAEGVNVIPIMDELGLSELRVRDAILRAAGAGDLFRQSLETGSKAWQENIALNKEAEERFQTTASQLQMLKNNLGNVASTFGDVLLPVINSAIEKHLIPLLDKIGSWDEDTKKMVVTLAGLAATIGPVLLITGKLAQSFVSIKAAGAVLAPIVGTITTALTGAASAATGASVAVGAGGKAMLAAGAAAGTALGPVLAIAAGVAGVATAGIALHRHMSQEAIPAVQLFGDEVSESTQQAVGAYMELDEKATLALKQLSWSGQSVTEEMGKTILGNFEEMNQQILGGLDKRHQESLSAMQQFFANSEKITEEEQQQILADMQAHHDKQKESVAEKEARILKILENASAEKRALTRKEQQEINSIQQEMKETGIRVLSETEVEARAILERMEQQAEEITARQASEIVKNSLEQKEKVIAEAEEQYEQTLKILIRQRDEVGSISKEQADKLIAEADRQRLESVSSAEKMHDKIIETAKLYAKEHERFVDWETGQLKTKWQVLGENIVQGFTQGIRWNTPEAEKAARDLARKSSLAIEEVYGIMSPSKLMAYYGDMVAQGLADGIERTSSKARDAAQKMADAISSAVRSISDELSIATDIAQVKFDLWRLKMGETATEGAVLKEKMATLQAQLETSAERVAILQQAYEDVAAAKGEAAIETQKLYLQLLEAQKAQEGLKQSIADTTKEMQGQISVGRNLLDVLDAHTTYYPGSGAIVKSKKSSSSQMTDLQRWAWGRLGELNKMADGGMIYKPTLLSDLTTGRPYAIAGEAGPEAVLPMTRGGQGAMQQQVAADIDYDRLAAAMARHAKPSITQHNKIIAQQPLSPAAVVREENKLLQRLGMAMG